MHSTICYNGILSKNHKKWQLESPYVNAIRPVWRTDSLCIEKRIPSEVFEIYFRETDLYARHFHRLLLFLAPFMWLVLRAALLIDNQSFH